VAMGYQIGVTPLQVAAAVSTVANGGELVEPRVVRAVIRDGVRQPVPRKVVGRAINAETAATLADIMQAVVDRGTGMNARVEGFTVAGKTGTAKKLVNGRYDGHNDYNVSFVGFVPSRQPEFTIVVVVDSPRKLPAYGSQVAAPVFHRIAAEALRRYGVAPTLNAAPPLLVARRPAPSRVEGSEPAVEQPLTGLADLPAIVTLASAPRQGSGQATTGTISSSLFPDLRGLGAREALRALAQIGVAPRLRGTGVVVDQLPEPGSAIERGSTATLTLERQPPARPAVDAAP
jgi:cell division protein FtsI (penicillin-binding protein 3)